MIYKFNNFEVNQELREVFYLGKALVVQPKVFDLLVFLIQNRNRAVSKNEIQDVVWANLEISETAMTRAIMKARKVLSVDEKKQPFIKTIHGHGYRFMPEVQEIEHNPNVSGTSKSTTSSPKNKSLLGILAFAVMCSLIVIGVIYSNQDKFTSDSRIAILPFIDKTNNQDYSWTSKGLMGLSTEIIKAQNNVKTVSTSQTSKVISTYNDLDLSAQEINDLKQSLQASHLVLVELLLQNSGVFNLNYVVYHPKGKQDIITLTGENPTELSQKMSKNIINMISGSSIGHKKYRVISDKPFTNELYARGIALRLEGKAKQARDYFKLAMAEDSGLFWPRYQYALTSRMIGLYDDSINELKKLKQELPQLATNDKDLATGIQNALGTAYMRKSENKQGLKHYENAYNLAVDNDNIDYAVKIATNIAWIYKDQRNFQQSRIWVSKSMQMLKEHNLPPLTNNLYLLGQLEYRMNHFDKAKSIFEEVFQIYMKENKKRNAAKVLNSLSSLASKTGNWTISQDYNNQSSKIFIEIKSDINLLNNKITQTSLYINQGEYSKASVLLDEIIAQSKTLDLEHKHIQILQTKLKLLFKKKKYPQVITVFNNLPSIKQSKINQIDQSEVLAAKSEYALGNQQPLLQLIKQYKSFALTANDNNDLTYDLMNIFVLEQEGKIQQLKLAYKDYIEKCRKRGFIAQVARYLLKLSYLYTDADSLTISNIFNDVQLFNLQWWQIELLEARVKFLDGKLVEAVSLAKQAKKKSTESWSDENQKLYNLIVGSL